MNESKGIYLKNLTTTSVDGAPSTAPIAGSPETTTTTAIPAGANHNTTATSNNNNKKGRHIGITSKDSIPFADDNEPFINSRYMTSSSTPIVTFWPLKLHF